MQPNQQPPQPSEPTPQPPAAPGPPRILQPLSSEDDIRREAEQVAPQPPTANTPSSDQADTNAPESLSYGLVTEPLHPRQPVPYMSPNPRTTATDTPKKRRGPVTFFVILIILSGLVVGLYFFSQIFSTKIATSDLIEESYRSTTYLRPRQWKPLTVANGSAYGDLKGKDGKSTALVTLRTLPTHFDVAESDYPALRTQVLDSLTETSLASSTGSSPCSSVTDVQKEADASTTATMVGLIKLTSTCVRSDGSFTLKMHGILGKDGYVRLIAIMAAQKTWAENEEVFQKVLDSVE